MATYKKRGFKNKASSSKAEALENKSTTANVFNTLEQKLLLKMRNQQR